MQKVEVKMQTLRPTFSRSVSLYPCSELRRAVLIEAIAIATNFVSLLQQRFVLAGSTFPAADKRSTQ